MRSPSELDARRSGRLVVQPKRPGWSARSAGLVAWIACAVVTALVVTAAVLFVYNYLAGSALGDFGLAHALIALTYAVVGALVVTRRPHNPVGWLLCFIAVPSALVVLPTSTRATACSPALDPWPRRRGWHGLAPGSGSSRFLPYRSCSCCFPRDGCYLPAGAGRSGGRAHRSRR